MASKPQKTLHIVMFPWLAFGHILPYFDLAKLIALHGHRISFVSAPRNIDRLPKLPPNLSSSITLIKIPLPELPELPEHASATADIDDGQMDSLKKAFDGLEPGLARFLDEARPDWIITDFTPHWLPPISARLDILQAVFWIVNSWFLSFFGPTDVLISGSDDRTEPEDFMVPPKWVGFETRVAYRRYEAKWTVGCVHGSGSGYSDVYRLGKVIEGSEAILIRDCYEFEPQWLGLVGELHRRRVFPVGLMPPAVQDHSTDEDDESWVVIKQFLDQKEKESVVYVALGSEVIPSHDQLTELARGLELSGVPFFWVLRKGSGSGLLPEGFEERVRGRGMVWRSWAPQLRILGHESLGGFLTHSGWGSVVEGLMFGLPLISLPFLIEQGLNSRLIVEKELGVEISRNEDDGSYTSDSVADSIKQVMIENDGRILRAKAKEMAGIFGDRELHGRYIHEFVDFLENHPNLSKC